MLRYRGHTSSAKTLLEALRALYRRVPKDMRDNIAKFGKDEQLQKAVEDIATWNQT